MRVSSKKQLSVIFKEILIQFLKYRVKQLVIQMVIQMIEFYGARWKIELGFKELKQDMGSQKSQCRT
jgi:IS4 transposase